MLYDRSEIESGHGQTAEEFASKGKNMKDKMIRFNVKGATGEQLAKRIMKLAWDSARVFGMGILQDRGKQSEDVVYNAAVTRHDYGGKGDESGLVNADYVFGRMMKLRIKVGSDYVACFPRDIAPDAYRSDYQSFAHKYANFGALVKAASESLKVEVDSGIEDYL